MSWLKGTSGTGVSSLRTARRDALLGVVVAGFLAAGCGGSGFQPLHGATASGGNLSTNLAGVDVTPIPGRVGQQLRNELLFQTRGGGDAAGSEYELQIAIRESVRSNIVQVDGDAQGATYRITSEFKLISSADNTVVLEGNNHAQAAYRKFDSIYANLRARRDAENRAAKDSARAIATRIATFLSRAS
ncbi:MAG: LPS assembly lipoprotein LptE [Hyphomicrobiaceae bacterium]